MLPKFRRLKTEDFKDMHKMRAVNAPHFLLRMSVGGNHGKVAVIVSSSNYKRAVDRNLLRRRMYHIIEKHYSKLHGKTVTVTIKKGALKASFGELEQEFLKAIR